MHELTQATLLDCLAAWGRYVEEFHRISPERQADFLLQQGYQRFGDVLAHVAGWWNEGLRVVDGVRADARFIHGEPDTDIFNADIVQKFATWNEADIIAHFEATRQKMIAMVASLATEMLAHPLVCEWLLADTIEHLEEHHLK